MVVALALGATTTAYANPIPENGIGIKLLDAPVSRRDDPRANIYIIDYLPPSTTIQRRVEIKNNTDKPWTVAVYAAAATIHDNAFTFADNRTANELSTWISLDRNSVDLPPRGKTTVLATIRVPQHATRGEQYAVIWAQVTAAPTASAGIGLINRVGVRVYLDVGLGGEPPSDFEIEKLTPVRAKDGRPEVLAQVHNTGARAVDITGSLALSGGPGSLSAGPFTVETGTTMAAGDRATVAVFLDKRLPNGPWTATLTLMSGLLQRTATATITFPNMGVGASIEVRSGWPYDLMMIGLPALLGVLLLAFLSRAWLRRRRLRAHTEQPDGK